MKKTLKILRIVLLVVLVLVVSIVVLIHFFGNSALKAGIETAGSKALNVGVSVGDVDLSIVGGKISLQKLAIDNPPDYQHDKLLEVGNARIAVDIGSLLTDTVEIKEIVLDEINLVIEQNGLTSNNLQDIIKAIPKTEDEPEDKTETATKKLHIGNLEITNVTVKAKLLPVPGKTDTVTLKLKPIRMTDLGSDNKLDAAKLSGKILLAIAAGVAEQGVGILPEGITDTMKTTLGKVSEVGKTVSEEGRKLLEEGAGKGEEIMEGFKGLLKPRK